MPSLDSPLRPERRLAESGAALIVMVGAPGTGKSFLARQIATCFDADLVQTDAVRKELFPEPRYSGKESAAVFEESHRRIRAGIRAGRHVVFDATNLRERRRTSLYQLGASLGAPTLVVRAYAPSWVVRERVTRRFAVPDPLDQSDADWMISRRLQRDAEPILHPHLVVNTTVAPEPALRVLGRLLAAGAAPAAAR